MRADAQQNRQQLLQVAIELILEVGGEPSRDAIAQRAGLGIGTLYRHFPDRQSLLHAVARHTLEKSISAGEFCVTNISDSLEALRHYMHAAVDNGLGVVNIIFPLLDKRDWPDLRTRAEKMMKTIVQRAKRDGKLREEITERDIVLATIRFSRPLGISISINDERKLAHRHVDFFVDGIRKNQYVKP